MDHEIETIPGSEIDPALERELRKTQQAQQAQRQQQQMHEERSSAAEQKKKRPFFQRPFVVLAIAALAIIAIFYAATVLLHAMTHETTDDAFINGHIITIAPKIAGRVLAVAVNDNQQVKKGDVLVEIDPRDLAAVTAQKRAALAAADARRINAQTAAEQAEAHMKTLLAVYQSVQATVASSRATANQSQSDLTRSQELSTGSVISKQELEHAATTVATALADLESKSKQLDAAAAYVDEAKKQVESARTQVDTAAAEVNEAKANLAQSELQLSYSKIVAPEDGRVTNKAVEPGDYLQIGQALLALVPNEVWITANFKETQLDEMRPGQPAMISIDAYPAHDLRGHVDSIQAGSGARFSLLPPENATGNFVKVVQRVPVKIVFDEQPNAQSVVGPGMSVVPDVKVKSGALLGVVIFAVACFLALAVFIGALIWLGKKRTA